MDAATGAAAGSMLGPWGAAAGGLLGGIGGMIAGNQSAAAARDAARQYAQYAAQGRQQLTAGRGQAETAYQPYGALGAQAAGQYGQALQQGVQQPQFGYKQQAFDFNTQTDPGAQYRMEQANKAIQASALAKGGLGGGTAKALQANSQAMAGQAFQDAYGRWENTSNMMYGQAAQDYGRNYGAQQDYLNRLQGATQQGQSGQLAQSGLLGQYDQGINSSWLGQGEAAMNAAGIGGGAKAAATQGMFKNLGSALGTGLNSYLDSRAMASGSTDDPWAEYNAGRGR